MDLFAYVSLFVKVFSDAEVFSQYHTVFKNDIPSNFSRKLRQVRS